MNARKNTQNNELIEIKKKIHDKKFELHYKEKLFVMTKDIEAKSEIEKEIQILKNEIRPLVLKLIECRKKVLL